MNRFFITEKAPSVDAAEDASAAALAGRDGGRKYGKISRRNVIGRGVKWQAEVSSVWVGRKEHGNAKDLYETPAALRRMFDADWRLASRAHGSFLIKTIQKYDTTRAAEGGAGSAAAGRRDEDNDEVSNVCEILANYRRPLCTPQARDAAHAATPPRAPPHASPHAPPHASQHAVHLVYTYALHQHAIRTLWCGDADAMFDYYACLDTSSSAILDRVVEHDVHNISMAAYLTMCRDCRLATPKLPSSALELIFVQVRAWVGKESRVAVRSLLSRPCVPVVRCERLPCAGC